MPRKKKIELDAAEAPAPRKRGRRKKAEAPPVPEQAPLELPASAAVEDSAQAPPVAETELPEVLPYTPAETPRDEPSPVTAPAQPRQSADLAEAERKLIERYPNVNIEAGSLRTGLAEGWGNKRIVTIRCAACNRPRIVATSDLFHVCHCEECSKAAKKASRKAKKQSETN